jgi:hypothetical protein
MGLRSSERATFSASREGRGNVRTVLGFVPGYVHRVVRAAARTISNLSRYGNGDYPVRNENNLEFPSFSRPSRLPLTHQRVAMGAVRQFAPRVATGSRPGSARRSEERVLRSSLGEPNDRRSFVQTLIVKAR